MVERASTTAALSHSVSNFLCMCLINGRVPVVWCTAAEGDTVDDHTASCHFFPFALSWLYIDNLEGKVKKSVHFSGITGQVS